MGQVVLPNTITNGTTNDATQVMADLQAITTQINGNIDHTNLASDTASLKQVTGGVDLVGRTGAAVPWVGMVRASAISTHVAATTQQALVAFTPNGDGIYLVGLAFDLNNGTSGNKINAFVSYTQAQSGTASNHAFTATGQVQTDGNTSLINGPYGCAPIIIMAKSGAGITVNYTDPTNTPNDYVSAFIMQIG